MRFRKSTRRLPLWLKIVLGIGALALIVVIGGLVFINVWPDVAAQNIDRLRDIIGDAPVAQLEAAILSIQDRTQQLEYQVGLVKPAAPWAVQHVEQATQQPAPTEPTNTPLSTLTTLLNTPAVTSTPALPRATSTPGPSPTPTFTATYITAVCSIVVSDAVVYATDSVSFTANVDRDERDSITAAAWFVNGASTGETNSTLTDVFSIPGTYTIKVSLSMKSGQSPSCETTLDVKVRPTPTSTPLFASSRPTDTPLNTVTPSPALPTSTPTSISQGPSSPTVQPAAPTKPIPTSAATAVSLRAWSLSPLTPMGRLEGEGQWSPYLQAADGQIVAYRTFLQPDPHRPYSIPAIVALDLQATRLHFVLGTVEPRSASPEPSRTGAIPAADLQAGKLLATFNGGFKARHGQYGAMADGVVALPPINGLATVAMYANGQVRIGEWGKDIQDSPELVAWRQNGEMLIRNGQINPDTAKTNEAWGLTIKGDTITWRSALGLSADGRTLYYVAGLQLDVATLTSVMAKAGAAEALQLDVNSFWVHFAAIRSEGSSLIAEPLFEAMKPQADRYLKSFSRDFFYITSASQR